RCSIFLSVAWSLVDAAACGPAGLAGLALAGVAAYKATTHATLTMMLFMHFSPEMAQIRRTGGETANGAPWSPGLPSPYRAPVPGTGSRPPLTPAIALRNTSVERQVDDSYSHPLRRVRPVVRDLERLSVGSPNSSGAWRARPIAGPG